MKSTKTRLPQAEAGRAFTGEVDQTTDAQLYDLVRSGYQELAAQHGSLALAINALRRTGNAEDAALATLIEEDTGGPDVRYH